MGKKSTEKTAGRKAYEAAKKAVSEAKTDAQKATAAEQLEKAKAALRVESGGKFKELAGKRVSKALNAIGGVGKLANARAYLFTTEQIDKIEKAMVDEVALCIKRYRSALGGKGKETGEAGFSL